MTKIKKLIAISALVALAATLLSGCMGFGGMGAAQSTIPPQKEYKTVDEFKKAVADAKAADESAADDEDLKNLTYYYDLKTLPDGAKLDYIKVSSQALRVGYTFGETSDETYDNRIEIAWYRQTKSADFLTQIAKGLVNYDTVSANGTDYIHNTPDINLTVTPAPGDTAVATPTPRTQKYCQFLYWVQGDAAFMSAVPLGFTQDDIGKYCQGVQVSLD